MSAQSLGSRAIIGAYYARLEVASGQSWMTAISNLFSSDQSSETYKWLGHVPAMREWIGGRNAKGFNDNGLTIINKHYEATLQVDVADLRRDKTGQVMARVNDLADRTVSHWSSLMTTLILNGPSTACYDGQFFFDTDHTEGNNTTSQSNDIDVDISAMPVNTAAVGSVTAPAAAEMMFAILKGIEAIMGFKDNENEPINENAHNFVVMVPVALWSHAIAAVKALRINQGEDNVISVSGMNISVEVNPRLTWTDSFAVFRTDSAVKPFIRQQETDVQMTAIAEGSEEEFKNKRHLYGVEAWRNVGYGMWQSSCYVTMT